MINYYFFPVSRGMVCGQFVDRIKSRNKGRVIPNSSFVVVINRAEYAVTY